MTFSLFRRHKGKYVVVEGGEGVGKTTHIRYIAELLGFRVVMTREPGGTPLGQKIRHLLFTYKLHPVVQMFLFFLDRFLHMKMVVKPALKKGMIIVSDRSYYSTWAYQVEAKKGSWFIKFLFYFFKLLVMRGLKPDLVIMLDIDPKEGLRRARGRGEGSNVFEDEEINFHEMVRRGMKKAIKKDKVPFAVIDTSGTKERSRRQIREVIVDKFKLKI